MKVIGTNISMIRGDSETILVSCSDVNNNPIAFVTGDTIYLTIKERSASATILLQKKVTSFEADGKAIIAILPIDTKNLNFKKYVYDIQLTRADQSVTTLIPVSEFEILEEVTYE